MPLSRVIEQKPLKTLINPSATTSSPAIVYPSNFNAPLVRRYERKKNSVFF